MHILIIYKVKKVKKILDTPSDEILIIASHMLNEGLTEWIVRPHETIFDDCRYFKIKITSSPDRNDPYLKCTLKVLHSVEEK